MGPAELHSDTSEAIGRRMYSAAGKLLVASPLLADPNFHRTVVLVIDHGVDGALGLVLNRPSDTPVGEMLERWAPVAAPPGVFFFGGPVSPESVISLGRYRPGTAVTTRRVIGDVGTVDLEADPALDVDAPTDVRLFAGYAGWSPGQLDEELALDGWIVVDALPSDPLTSDPSGLWAAVLRRQGGSLQWLAAFPHDLEAN